MLLWHWCILLLSHRITENAGNPESLTLFLLLQAAEKHYMLGWKPFKEAKELTEKSGLHRYTVDLIILLYACIRLRKLYVALTRAKEKLIIVATLKAERINSKGEVISGYKSAREKWNSRYSPNEGVMRPDVVNSASRYIDLIAPIVLAHKKDSKFLNYVIPYNPERETMEEDERVKYCGEGVSGELIDELLDSAVVSVVSVFSVVVSAFFSAFGTAFRFVD